MTTTEAGTAAERLARWLVRNDELLAEEASILGEQRHVELTYKLALAEGRPAAECAKLAQQLAKLKQLLDGYPGALAHVREQIAALEPEARAEELAHVRAEIPAAIVECDKGVLALCALLRELAGQLQPALVAVDAQDARVRVLVMAEARLLGEDAREAAIRWGQHAPDGLDARALAHGFEVARALARYLARNQQSATEVETEQEPQATPRSVPFIEPTAPPRDDVIRMR
jgi:hypothetical protein